MNIDEIKEIISKNSQDIAFIIGNGINLHFNKNHSSWKDLLLDLWSKHSFYTQSNIPSGISFTEFYDALEIQNYNKKNFSAELQSNVQDIIKDWKPNSKQNIILDRIRKIDVPILTTNFDKLIPDSQDLKFFRQTAQNLQIIIRGHVITVQGS